MSKAHFAVLSQIWHFPDLLLLIHSSICLHGCFCQPTFSCHWPPQKIIINSEYTHRDVTESKLDAQRGLEAIRTWNHTAFLMSFFIRVIYFSPKTTALIFRWYFIVHDNKGLKKKPQDIWAMECCLLTEYIEHILWKLLISVEGSTLI